jgi:hypothetical protein
VPVRSESPSVRRSAQLERDRRAINLVGHLLTTGIWLEHQLRATVTPGGGVVEMSDWVRSPLRRLSSVDVPFAPPSGKQPSPIADVELISR